MKACSTNGGNLGYTKLKNRSKRSPMRLRELDQVNPLCVIFTCENMLLWKKNPVFCSNTLQ